MAKFVLRKKTYHYILHFPYKLSFFLGIWDTSSSRLGVWTACFRCLRRGRSASTACSRFAGAGAKAGSRRPSAWRSVARSFSGTPAYAFTSNHVPYLFVIYQSLTHTRKQLFLFLLRQVQDILWISSLKLFCRRCCTCGFTLVLFAKLEFLN